MIFRHGQMGKACVSIIHRMPPAGRKVNDTPESPLGSQEPLLPMLA